MTDPSPPGVDGLLPFDVRTLDGVRIAGVELSSPAPSGVAVVLGHGFLGTWKRPQNVELATTLSERHTVYLFDFRGHGASQGLSTVGDREALDVQAVAAHAREQGHGKVVTIGASMGAISVLREAARFGDVDGIVSISSPGRWSGHGRFARIAGVLVSTRAGRAFAGRVFNTHVYPEWTWSPPPVDMIEQITAPTLVVHGSNDKFIPRAQAELLFARAKPPKRLIVLDGFGHAELGYTPAFGKLLLGEIDGMLSGDGWGVPGDASLPHVSGAS